MVIIDKEVEKISDVGFITEKKYHTWLTIMVLVRKTINIWNMCVDFSILNVTCPKDLYLLSHVDRLIN